MRWDVRVAAHFYLSAAFLSVCVMAAPDYLHLTDTLKAIGFWGGLIGAICFALAGFRAAIREERAAPKTGHRRRMIAIYGMVVCGIGFLGSAAFYFWPSKSNEDTADASPLDRKISFNCYNGVRPTHFREDRPLYVVPLVSG